MIVNPVLVCLLLLLSSLPSLALPSDARLERHISLAETGITLETLLKKVSDGELTLVAGPSCAEQKVQVRLKKRTVRALMTALADMLPGEWAEREDKSGYVLAMSKDAVKQRDEWWRLFQGEHDRGIAAQKAYTLKMMQAAPKSADDYLQNFFHLLPGELQQRIADNMEEFVFDRASIGVSSNEAEGGTAVTWNTLSAEAQEQIPLLLHHPVSFPTDFALNIQNAGISIDVLPYSQISPLKGAIGYLDGDVATEASPMALNQSRLLRNMPKLGSHIPEAWKQLAAYQQRRVWPNDSPDKTTKLSFAETRRVDWLNWLAAKADLEYVADYYSLSGDPMSDQQKQTTFSLPLKAELDGMAASPFQDFSWEKDTDGLYLFRDNRWYRDDRLEVPEKIAKRLLAEVPKGANGKSAAWKFGKPLSPVIIRQQLDFDSDIATSLTRWQSAQGLLWYAQETPDQNSPGATLPTYPFTNSSERVATSRLTLAFYAGLNGNSRDLLIAGTLPVQSLLPLQQQQAAYLVPALQIIDPAQSQSFLGIREPQSGPGKVYMVMGQNARTGAAENLPPLRLYLIPSKPVSE